MGAWGSGPLDNDTAADWFYQIDKVPAVSMIKDGLVSSDYYEVRAAAWLLEQIGYNYVYPSILITHKALAISKLQSIATDDEWLNDWSNPKEVHASIMAQIYRLSEKK